MTDKEKLEEIKNKYDENENKQAEIDIELNEVESMVVSKKFNPSNEDILDIYDIMDEVSSWQLKLLKTHKKAIRYEMSAELLGKTFEKVNNDLYCTFLLSKELKDEVLKNIDEKKAWINKKLNEDGILTLLTYAEKQKIRAKKTLKQVELVADVISSLSEQVSRKVSVMQLQSGLGMLGKDRVDK